MISDVKSMSLSQLLVHTTILCVRCSCDLEKLNTKNPFPGSGISLNLRVLTWNNLFFERYSKRQCRKLEIFQKLMFMIPKKTDSCEVMKIKIWRTTVLLIEPASHSGGSAISPLFVLLRRDQPSPSIPRPKVEIS